MKKISVRGSIVSNDEKWIYDWFGIEATSPNDVRKTLNEANGEPVLVEINSGGGDLFAGSEIYSSLKAYEGDVEIHILGLAASAASIIAQAGKSKISPTAMFMVHNVSGGACGDYHEMLHQAEVLETANRAVASAYMEKTGKTMEELQDIMDKETWLDAVKAVEHGFVDEVMFATAPVLTNGFGILSAETIEKMRMTIGIPKKVEEPIENVELAKAKLNLLRKRGEIRNEI